MTAGEIYNSFKAYLENRGIPDPGTDALYIISHHLGLKPYEIFLKRNLKVPLLTMALIKHSMIERGRSKPVAYILGYKYFYLDKFIVNSGTIIPRSDSEHLIYAAEELQSDFKNIIDIGTGSGALAVSLSRINPSSRITAIDIDIGVAAQNIKRLGAKNITLIKSDFLKNRDGIKGNRTFCYDLIVSNPPYLSMEDMKKFSGTLCYEPFRAFYGGENGLAFYCAISEFAKAGLLKGGFIIIEIGYKWPEVMKIFEDHGFSIIGIRKDYGGLERVMVIRKDF